MSHLGVGTRNPDRALAEIGAQASRDGRSGYPAISPGGQPAPGYLKDTYEAAAGAAASNAVGERMTDRAPQTRALWEKVGAVLAQTKVVEEARKVADRAVHTRVALENRARTSERERPFLRGLALPAVGVMAAAAAVNLFGGLSEVTEDGQWGLVALAVGIGVAVVLIPIPVARLLKGIELDARERGKLVSASRVIPLVVAMGVVAMLTIPLGVAQVRAVGHQVASERQEQTADAGFEVIGLDGDTTVDAAGTSADAAVPDKDEEDHPTVPYWTWALFEAAMVMAAFLIEFIAYSPIRERVADARRDAEAATDAWRVSHGQLGQQVAAAKAAHELRSESDLATVAAAEATVGFAAAQWSFYRDRNLAARPQIAGDPWASVPAADPAAADSDAAVEIAAKDHEHPAPRPFPASFTQWFTTHTGTDMSTYPDPSPSSGPDTDPVIELYHHAMTAAVQELDQGLTPIELVPVTYDPQSSVDHDLEIDDDTNTPLGDPSGQGPVPDSTPPEPSTTPDPTIEIPEPTGDDTVVDLTVEDPADEDLVL